MTITLRPEQEQLIAAAMETGAYQHPEEVISRALEILHSDDEWLYRHKDEINEKIERALDQFKQGAFFSAEQSRNDMEQRKTAWVADQKR